MTPLLIALLVGALLPVAVALVVLLASATRGGRTDWPMAIAFSKGLGLGVAIGLTVSAITLAAIAGIVYLSGR